MSVPHLIEHSVEVGLAGSVRDSGIEHHASSPRVLWNVRNAGNPPSMKRSSANSALSTKSATFV